MHNITHITTVHPRRDTRVFYRECISLSNNGYNVTLVVADGLGDENYKSVNIIDLGKRKNRIVNFIVTFFKIFGYIKNNPQDIIHFHDAELMIVHYFLRKNNNAIFYDIHENVAEQILDKKHISKYLRRPLHIIYKFTERLLINNFHLIVAEKSYLPIYLNRGMSLTTVLNLPETNSFNHYVVSDRVDKGIFYIGGISLDRGVDTIIGALKILDKKKIDFKMHFVGAVSDSLKNSLDFKSIKSKIVFYGRQDLLKGYEISKKCKVGLAILKPIKNYKESYPTKIFEYMSIKLPVISSNFELYKNVVEKENCGFCVDPFSAEDLAKKIEVLIKDNKLTTQMGENGFNAVNRTYNWKNEEQKLFSSYKKVLNK